MRDWRGGGRSSARETAARVAAGAVARLVIPEVAIRAYVVEIGGDPIDRAHFDDGAIDANPFFCPDPAAAMRWEGLVDDARKDGSSLGAVIECVATGVPAGWGAPIYAKLDAELAAAMMGINAVKGVEIGDGFAAARLRGEDNADAMRPGADGKPTFLANHAGGVAGGIATGQPVVVRVAFKPTSSILTPVRDDRRDRRRDRDRHQGPPRSLRRHSRRAGGRGDDGAGAGRPETAPPGAMRMNARSGRAGRTRATRSRSKPARSTARTKCSRLMRAMGG